MNNTTEQLTNTTINRKPCVVGNWKMVGSLNRIADLMQSFLNHLSSLEHLDKIDIVVCPPFPYLQWVQGFLQKQKTTLPTLSRLSSGVASSSGRAAYSPVALGAQNVHFEPEGAYTGEVSISMLSDLDCRYVILGHSERRQGFQETDAIIARKFRAAYDAGLIPILCVGETQAERTAGETFSVVSRQLGAVLKEVDPLVFRKALLAYEPVWAIGTGQTATPEQAAEVHAFLRSQFKTSTAGCIGVDCASEVKILYGGSVKASNAAQLFAQVEIDGALVGGASLNAEEFFNICRLAIKAKFTDAGAGF